MRRMMAAIAGQAAASWCSVTSDGVDEYMETSSAVDPGTGTDVTRGVVFRSPDTASNQCKLLSNASGAGTLLYTWGSLRGNVPTVKATGGTSAGNGGVSDDTWAHATVASDAAGSSGRADLYVDGVELSYVSQGTASAMVSGALRVLRAGSNYGEAIVAFVYAGQFKISAAQIAQLHDDYVASNDFQGAADYLYGLDTSFSAWGFPSTLDLATDTVADLTPNGVTLSLYSFETVDLTTELPSF